MNNNLGPVQQIVLSKMKEYNKLHKLELITIDAMVNYTGMEYKTIRKAMDNLARKQMLRRISPKRGYGLLV